MYDPHEDFDGTCMAPGCKSAVPAPTPRKRKNGQDDDGRTTRDQRRTCSARCRTVLSR